MAAVKTPQLPQPPAQLVMIARSKADHEIRLLRTWLERGERSYRQQSERTRANPGPDTGLDVLGMMGQANDETRRAISAIESLSDRDAVLRFVPEAGESSWAIRRPPAM